MKRLVSTLTYAATSAVLVIFSSAACGGSGASSGPAASSPPASVNVYDPAGLSPTAACTAFFSKDSSLMNSIAGDSYTADTATTDATYYSTIDFGLATYAARNSATANAAQIQTLRSDAQTIATALQGIADAQGTNGTDVEAAYTRLEFAHSKFQTDCDAVIPSPPL